MCCKEANVKGEGGTRRRCLQCMLRHRQHMLQSLSHFLVPYIGALLWPTIQVCSLFNHLKHLLVAMVFGTSFSHSVNCLVFGAKLGCSVHNCQEGKPAMSAHTPNFWVFLLGICFHRRSILFSMLQTHTF